MVETQEGLKEADKIWSLPGQSEASCLNIQGMSQLILMLVVHYLLLLCWIRRFLFQASGALAERRLVYDYMMIFMLPSNFVFIKSLLLC